MVNVKICGITNLEDALAASGSGADMLGFNFYEGSPRYLEPRSAKKIIGQLPRTVENVGVFVNTSVENILAAAEAAGLDAIQLHGDESAEFVNDLALKTGLRIIKGFRVNDSFQVEDMAEFVVDTVLLDSFSRSEYGGTGKTFDWRLACAVSKVHKTILAGGLCPENVAQTIRIVRPFGVDACSRLESSPGKKDVARVKQFIRIAKSSL